MASKDYNWYLSADLAKYRGEYVIISHQKVVYHGNDLKEMLREFRKKFPEETPTIAKIPEEETLIL